MKWPTCKTANAEFKDGMLKVQAYSLFPDGPKLSIGKL
jgi:hypothetical protein